MFKNPVEYFGDRDFKKYCKQRPNQTFKLSRLIFHLIMQVAYHLNKLEPYPDTDQLYSIFKNSQGLLG